MHHQIHAGLNISQEEQFIPDIASTRKKLAFLSIARLSLAGRVFVVNQIFLATACYVASSRCLSRACAKKYEDSFVTLFGQALMALET